MWKEIGLKGQSGKGKMRTQIMDLEKDQGLNLNMAALAVRDTMALRVNNGLLESFLEEAAWRLHWATTGILRAFQAGRTACAKAERCGGIWCVLESIGTRVYVWVSGVWDKSGT